HPAFQLGPKRDQLAVHRGGVAMRLPEAGNWDVPGPTSDPLNRFAATFDHLQATPSPTPSGSEPGAGNDNMAVPVVVEHDVYVRAVRPSRLEPREQARRQLAALLCGDQFAAVVPVVACLTVWADGHPHARAPPGGLAAADWLGHQLVRVSMPAQP